MPADEVRASCTPFEHAVIVHGRFDLHVSGWGFLRAAVLFSACFTGGFSRGSPLPCVEGAGSHGPGN